ncbi:hypothetical protein Tco_1035155, partial [Tanacetum coccineum]
DVVVSSVVEENVLSSLGGPTVEKSVSLGINNGMQDGNVEQCAISTRSALSEGIVSESPTHPNKFNVSLSGPTSYAKLVTGEPSRKSVNFRTLLAPAGNGAHVVISLES